MIYPFLIAFVSALSAGFQVPIYITPKSRASLHVYSVVYAVLTLGVLLSPFDWLSDLLSLVFLVVTTRVCQLLFHGETFCLLYNNAIQTVVTLGSMYVGEAFFGMGAGALATVALLNGWWCLYMYLNRYTSFRMMPYSENDYTTALLKCIVLDLLILALRHFTLFLSTFDARRIFLVCFTMILAMTLRLILDTFILANVDLSEQNKMREIEAKNAILKTYIDDFMAYSQKLEVINHDHKHLVRSLSVLIDQGEYEQMAELVKKMNIAYDQARTEVYCPDAIINAVVTDAVRKCKESGIRFEPVIRISAPVLVDDIDLTSILMNIVYNAIENCSAEEGKERYIELSVYSVGDYVVIRCSNSVLEEPVIIDNKIATTKKNPVGHGIGLESVKVSTLKYGGKVKLHTENHIFTIKVILENTEVS